MALTATTIIIIIVILILLVVGIGFLIYYYKKKKGSDGGGGDNGGDDEDDGDGNSGDNLVGNFIDPLGIFRGARRNTKTYSNNKLKMKFYDNHKGLYKTKHHNGYFSSKNGNEFFFYDDKNKKVLCKAKVKYSNGNSIIKITCDRKSILSDLDGHNEFDLKRVD